MGLDITSFREAPRLTAKSSEWYSPGYIRDVALDWMGGIDLDPASSPIANAHIGAGCFYGPDDNGLVLPWAGRVFNNPPTPPRAFWERTVENFRNRTVEQVFYLAYSVESLSASQSWSNGVGMTAFSFCIPKKRIRFLCTAAEAVAKLIARVEAQRLAANVPIKDIHANLRKLERLSAQPPTTLVPGTQPTHASALVAVGPDHARFARACRAIGDVVRL